MDSAERVWQEQRLRRAILAGDEQAWRLLYDGAYTGLHAYVSWRCGGWRDLTEVVVQETWLVAVRRIRRFAPEQGSFLGWLRGIAANVLRNRLRKQPRDQCLSQSLNGQPATVAPADSELLRAESARLIAEALAGLSERHEAVLRAKYLDGQSVNEIADDWNETPKAIESLLTRARQAFREAYQHGDPNHEPTTGR